MLEQALRSFHVSRVYTKYATRYTAYASRLALYTPTLHPPLVSVYTNRQTLIQIRVAQLIVPLGFSFKM
jgi:hypothetical protein